MGIRNEKERILENEGVVRGDGGRKILLQVHDELVFEVWEPEIEEIKKMVKAEREGVARLQVHLKVEIGLGLHWG